MPQTAIDRPPALDAGAARPDWREHGDRDHIPNAETLAAMRETDEYFRLLEEGKIQPRFANVAEFFISLFSFEEEEPEC